MGTREASTHYSQISPCDSERKATPTLRIPHLENHSTRLPMNTTRTKDLEPEGEIKEIAP